MVLCEQEQLDKKIFFENQWSLSVAEVKNVVRVIDLFKTKFLLQNATYMMYKSVVKGQ